MTWVSTDYYGHVREFHQAIDIPCRDTLTRLDSQEVQLRKRLITEEYEECIEALESGDIGAALHELCDLLYVVYGTFAYFGVNPAHGFRAVHDANMTKVGAPKDEHGKQTKPKNWKPANLNEVYGIR